MRLKLVCILFLVLVMACGGAKKTNIPQPGDSAIWAEIQEYFSPPAEWADELGDYRSPLVFYNGDTVVSRREWARRKEEIRSTWMEKMGEWPDLMTDQRLEVMAQERREDFTQYTVEFDWIPGERTDGYLLVPDEPGEKPAVITVYYEPETAANLNDKVNRDFAFQLAKRGFVTLSIGTREASEAKTYALYYPHIDRAEVEPLSMLAYAAANAWYALSHHPEVDPDRIGITGHSFGGKWSMFASCLFDKFACAAWSDPGIAFQNDRPSINYWEPWYLGYHPRPWRQRGLITPDNPAYGLYPQLMEEGFNLQELHALMAPRPFLVSGGSEDPPSRWTILNHSRQVNQLLGYTDRVAMHNRPEHSPNPESNEVIYRFFEYWLKERR